MKEFTKSDLKNRMVVEYRNGERRMVVDDVLVGNDHWDELNVYNEDLFHKEFHSQDIVRVYPRVFNFHTILDIELICAPTWERSEVKEVTMAEVEEKFGCKVKIVKEEEK